MAIFRGVGGSGDSSDNSFLQEVTAQASAAEASATSAANSLAAIQDTEITSASFDTSDGVLTLTKTGGATVTADLDGRFLTSYTETNDLSTAVTWANVPDANITESSVTQHLTAANVTSPLTGGTGISIASNGTITNDSPDQTVALTGTGATTITGTYPNFTIDSTDTTYTVGDGGLTTNDFTDADHSKLDGIEANATADQTDAEIKTAYENNADTNAFTDAEKTKLSNIEASADVTDTANVTSAGALMTTGGEMTGNITFSGTQTVDGRDLSVDGARLDTLERTARLRFQKRGYSNTVSFLTLTTSYQQVGQALRLNDASGIDCENELELNIILNYADINSSNEGFFAVTVNAPAPAGETTVNLGTVITTTSVGSSFTFEVAGNVTKHMSPYCGMSVNSDGSSAFGFNNSDGWFYDPQTNRTTVEVYAYQANKPTTGDTVYLHPFDWETSGTEIFGDTYPLEAYNASGTVNQNQFYKIYLGYHEGGRYYRIKARETTTSENLSISLMNGTYSQIIGG